MPAILNSVPQGTSVSIPSSAGTNIFDVEDFLP